MNLEYGSNQIKPEQSFSLLDILGRICEVTAEQIDTFKHALPERNQEYFEQDISEQDQKIFVLISQLSEKELQQLAKLEMKQGMLMGFHNFSGYLQQLSMLTSNNKYINLVRNNSDMH